MLGNKFCGERKQIMAGKTETRLKSFTLVEILVVVAIIAVLTVVVVESLSDVKVRSRNAKRMEDLRSVYTALISYYYRATPYYYPVSNTSGLLKNINGLVPVYIQDIPSDPKSVNSEYVYKAVKSNGFACTNVNPDYCKQFILCGDLEPNSDNEIFCCNRDGCNRKVSAGNCASLSACP